MKMKVVEKKHLHKRVFDDWELLKNTELAPNTKKLFDTGLKVVNLFHRRPPKSVSNPTLIKIICKKYCSRNGFVLDYHLDYLEKLIAITSFGERFNYFCVARTKNQMRAIEIFKKLFEDDFWHKYDHCPERFCPKVFHDGIDLIFLDLYRRGRLKELVLDNCKKMLKDCGHLVVLGQKEPVKLKGFEYIESFKLTNKKKHHVYRLL